MKNVLIVATQPQRFLDQLNLANELSKKSRNTIEIFFFIDDITYTKYKNEIDKFTFKIINKPSIIKSKNISNRQILKEKIKQLLTVSQKQKIRNIINKLKNTFLFTYRYKKKENDYLKDLYNKYNYISKLVLANKIDVLLVNGDRHIGYEPVFLKVAKEYNIPAIIPYMVYFATPESLLKVEKVNYIDGFFISTYIKKSQKKFQYHKINNQYYYPHYIANALDKFGVLTDNPWFMGNGYSNILCLPNDYMKELYIKEGNVTENKIKVIGDIAYDRLYESYVQKKQIKEKIFDKYNLSENKKLIIIALPQLAEHGILSWDKHWKEIEFLMDNVNQLEQNILLSLHPKMEKEKYQFLEEKYNCKILDERLYEVLPIADMFIATFSSTVIWAVLCGVKTIVVDFYGFNYTIYDFLSSIEKVSDKKNFLKTLNTVLKKDIDFTNDWEKLSRDKVFDGKTIERYIKLINEVIKCQN